MSATKEELTLMLYEGGLKFCNQAILALNESNYVKLNELVRRVCDIIIEFQLTLDRKYPISQNFDVLYSYMIETITEGAVDHDINKFNTVRDLFRDFRDMWKEEMRIAKQEHHGQSSIPDSSYKSGYKV